MQQSSKTTQYLASALLAGLILPVSLMAQFQSAFAAGSLARSKEARAEARINFDESKAALHAARQAYNADKTPDNKAAVNAAVKAKQAEKNDLIQAQIEVQIVRAKKGGASEADLAALKAAATNAESIATQIEAQDISTEEGRQEAGRLKKQLDLASRTKVVSATNQARVKTAGVLVKKIETVMRKAGGVELVSACSSEFNAFQTSAAAAHNAYGAVGSATTVESAETVTNAAKSAWQIARNAWLNLKTCALGVTGISSYESCVAKGGNVTQTSTSTPQTCRIYGRSFSNDTTTTTATPAGSSTESRVQASCTNGQFRGDSRGATCYCDSGEPPVLVGTNSWECRPTAEPYCDGGLISIVSGSSGQATICICNNPGFAAEKIGINTWKCIGGNTNTPLTP